MHPVIRVSVVIHAAGVLRACIVVHGTTAVVFEKKLFDLPVALLGADAELQIFSGNGVPVLRQDLGLASLLY